MSTTSVSFKVEALPVGWEQLDHMAKAAALLAHEERVLAAQAKAAAAAVASLTREEVESASAARLAAAADSARAKALGITTSQMHQMAGGMDAAGYAAGNLRFQMFDVGQSLALGMNPMMVLAQQGPQVAQAFTQASQAGGTMGSTIMAALGPMAAMLPIVAVAAGGLAMAYQGLTAKSEAAADAQAALAMGYDHTTDLMQEATRSAYRLDLIMAGASSEALAAADTFYATGDAYREATKESDALIASNVKLLELDGVPKDWETVIGGVSRGFGDLADAIDRVDGGVSGLATKTGLFAFLTSAMDGVSTSTAELERETQAAVVGQLKMRDATEDVRRAKAAEANATHDQTGATKEHRKELGEAAQALNAWVAAMQDAAEVQTALATANADILTAGLSTFGDLEAAARASSLTELEQIEATAAAKIKVADEAMRRILAISGIQASAVEAAEAEHQAAVLAIQKQAAAARDELLAGAQQKVMDAFGAGLESLVPSSAMSDMEKLTKLAGEMAQAYADGAISAKQLADLTDKVETVQVAITSKAQSVAMTTTAGKVGQAVSSPLQAAASMHPIAQAVLAGLQSSAGMRDGSSVFTEAADLITAALSNLGDFVASAFAAAGDIIANAPRLLVEAIPEILRAVVDGIPALAESVASMATGLVVALAEALPQIIPDLVIILGQVFIGAVPMIAVAIATALLTPAFYEAIIDGFVRGFEAAFARIGDVGDGLTTGTTAGGGFSLFGVQLTSDTSAGPNQKQSIFIEAGDLWSDFSRELATENSKLGRT